MSEPRSRAILLLAISMLATLTLDGCVVAVRPAHPYYVGEAVAVAPPPLRVEEYGPPPQPGFVWIGGYWNWVGGRHEWVGGHWEAPPHPGAHWVAHRWVHEHDGWHLSPGHWDRR